MMWVDKIHHNTGVTLYIGWAVYMYKFYGGLLEWTPSKWIYVKRFLMTHTTHSHQLLQSPPIAYQRCVTFRFLCYRSLTCMYLSYALLFETLQFLRKKLPYRHQNGWFVYTLWKRPLTPLSLSQPKKYRCLIIIQNSQYTGDNRFFDIDYPTQVMDEHLEFFWMRQSFFHQQITDRSSRFRDIAIFFLVVSSSSNSSSSSRNSVFLYVELQDQWNGAYFVFLKSHISAPGAQNSPIFSQLQFSHNIYMS